MTGIQYIIDDKGRKVAAQIDLRQHKALWEDLQYVLVARSRQSEKSVPLEEVKGSLMRRRRLRE